MPDTDQLRKALEFREAAKEAAMSALKELDDNRKVLEAKDELPTQIEWTIYTMRFMNMQMTQDAYVMAELNYLGLAGGMSQEALVAMANALHETRKGMFVYQQRYDDHAGYA